MVLIICTKNKSNLTNRYWDMVPDRQKVWTDGMDRRTDGRRQNYIPPTSPGDNNTVHSLYNIPRYNIMGESLKVPKSWGYKFKV